MARKVGVNEFAHRGYRGRLINWEKWCTGDDWVLEQGVDFHGERIDSTRSAGAQWATRNGMRAETEIVGPTEFTFKITEGLSDRLRSAAKHVQALIDAEAPEDEVDAAIRTARTIVREQTAATKPAKEPKEPREPKAWAPKGDPIKARADRLSGEIAEAGGPAAYARTARRPAGRRPNAPKWK